jgi:hypothetical protein
MTNGSLTTVCVQGACVNLVYVRKDDLSNMKAAVTVLALEKSGNEADEYPTSRGDLSCTVLPWPRLNRSLGSVTS